MNKLKLIHRTMGLLFIAFLSINFGSCSTIKTDRENTALLLGTLTAYVAETEESNSLSYYLYTPANPTSDMPLIVYLHGASGRGENLENILSCEDFPKYLSSGLFEDLNAYVLIPQLSSGLRSWSYVFSDLFALIQKTIAEYSIDKTNIALSGFSMGGTATWEFASEHPELFSRIAPLAGSAKAVLEKTEELQEIEIWAFAGSIDTVIPPNSSKEMIMKLSRAGAVAEITVFEGKDHESVPSSAFLHENYSLVDWLVGNNQ